MTPFYFRPGETALFGFYHPAEAVPHPRGAVLLCHAWGHEYMASHRAMRQLATRLAQAGWAVMRFDWRGTGDSAGSSDAATLDDLRIDLRDAVNELQRRSGQSQVIIAGLRLGASLALLHAEHAGHVDALVLWDPMVQGATWPDERRQQQDQAEESDVWPSAPSSMNLQTMAMSPTPHVLLVDAATPRTDTAALAEHLQRLGSVVERRTLTYPPGWLDPGSSVVPGSVIQSVIGWLKQIGDSASLSQHR